MSFCKGKKNVNTSGKTFSQSRDLRKGNRKLRQQRARVISVCCLSIFRALLDRLRSLACPLRERGGWVKIKSLLVEERDPASEAGERKNEEKEAHSVRLTNNLKVLESNLKKYWIALGFKQEQSPLATCDGHSSFRKQRICIFSSHLFGVNTLKTSVYSFGEAGENFSTSSRKFVFLCSSYSQYLNVILSSSIYCPAFFPFLNISFFFEHLPTHTLLSLF